MVALDRLLSEPLIDANASARPSSDRQGRTRKTALAPGRSRPTRRSTYFGLGVVRPIVAFYDRHTHLALKPLKCSSSGGAHSYCHQCSVRPADLAATSG